TMADEAAAAWLRGDEHDSHIESTVWRASVAKHALGYAKPFTVDGSITLNHAVGGVNPLAVEAALKTGARMIWMPTVDSEAHARAYGHTGIWDVQRVDRMARRPAPICILANGGLTPQAAEVLELCQQANVTLATGHL